MAPASTTALHCHALRRSSIHTISRHATTHLCLCRARVVTAGTAHGQSVTAAQLDSIIRRAVAEKHLIGVIGGHDAKREGGPRQGVRRSRLSHRRPGHAARTMFAIGSVTKQFTCQLRSLILAEQQKLSLKRSGRRSTIPISRAQGHHAARPRRAPVRLSRLLSARLRRSRDAEAADGGRDHHGIRHASARFRAAVALLVQQYGLSHPRPGGREGERRAVRVSSLARRIFTPLGLSRTAYEPAMRRRHGARVHVVRARRADARPNPRRRAGPATAGAIWSTPTDLLTWDHSLLDAQAALREVVRRAHDAAAADRRPHERLRLRRERERSRGRR